MAKKRTADLALGDLALSYDGVTAAAVCSRTAYKAGAKTFVSIGADGDSVVVLLKLGESLPEATALASAQAERFRVGKGGWVTTTFPRGEAAPAVLKRWIDESYRLMATPAKKRRAKKA